MLDYGKVLSQPQPAADKARIEALAGLPGTRLWPVYWAERLDYDRGVLDGPGFWTRVAERLGRRLAGPALAELTSADTQSWSHLDPVMVGWAASLAPTPGTRNGRAGRARRGGRSCGSSDSGASCAW